MILTLQSRPRANLVRASLSPVESLIPSTRQYSSVTERLTEEEYLRIAECSSLSPHSLDAGTSRRRVASTAL